MDFAKKQLEKFGWKEGSGLGKNNQGMLQAIKPTLKVGKEGMGFDFSKELVDTWWTRAYDDSLNRINVETDGKTSETVGVTLQEDEEEEGQKKEKEGGLVSSSTAVERPFEKMRKRMMKATFTTFSKGATLSNGEMIAELKAESDSEDSEDDDSKKKSKELKNLTDEELFKACGGRTAHKAARFGLKLNGKLARIAAQEEATKALLSSSSQKSHKDKSSKKGLADTGDTDKQPISSESSSSSSPLRESDEPDVSQSKKDKKKKKKNKSKRELIEENVVEQEALLDHPPTVPSSELPQNDSEDDSKDSKKKRKKHKKRKYAELEEPQQDNAVTSTSVDQTVENEIDESNCISSSSKKAHKKSKSKKLKLSKRENESDEETHALLSE